MVLENNKRRSAGFILAAVMMIIGTGCGNGEKADPVYKTKIEEWHRQRIASLTKPNGWLSLTGLFWLESGRNRFGGAPSNDIVFPGENVPDVIGTISLNGDSIRVEIKSGVEVLNEGQPVRNMELKSDAEGRPTILQLGSLSWYIIRRGERYGIRLKDSESGRLKNFRGIESYPIDPRWRLEARFEPYDSLRIISVPTVLGTVTDAESPGALVFEIDGRTCRLDPVGEPDDEQFFIIFADETNGSETYGAGRFLYVDNPGPEGKTVIDFNKAYNPPCAFTPYATCPLPPAQNVLPVRITAGEKKYGHDHH